MAARRHEVGRDRGDDHVVRFPPIPRVPPPPLFPADPRQAGATRIIGAVGRAAKTKMHVAGPNLARGFYASAVDLGKLQHVLERGLSRFDAARIEERWSEIFEWIRVVVGTWVQRRKQMKIERFENGIRVEMQTQDDLGYYHYEFDVFPARGRARRASASTSSSSTRRT